MLLLFSYVAILLSCVQVAHLLLHVARCLLPGLRRRQLLRVLGSRILGFQLHLAHVLRHRPFLHVRGWQGRLRREGIMGGLHIQLLLIQLSHHGKGLLRLLHHNWAIWLPDQRLQVKLGLVVYLWPLYWDRHVILWVNALVVVVLVVANGLHIGAGRGRLLLAIISLLLIIHGAILLRVVALRISHGGLLRRALVLWHLVGRPLPWVLVHQAWRLRSHHGCIGVLLALTLIDRRNLLCETILEVALPVLVDGMAHGLQERLRLGRALVVHGRVPGVHVQCAANGAAS